MKDQLKLAEWKIENIYKDYDYHRANSTKKALIMGNGFACDIPLYENDMNLLKTILDCDKEEDIIGRKVIAVNQDFIIKAIGNQGLYIPLYYSDNSSKILSENELCELLDCYNIVRLKMRLYEEDEIIASYEVPRKNINSKSRPKQLIKRKK